MAAGGVGHALVMVSEQTIVQRRASRAVRSRVMAAQGAVAVLSPGLAVGPGALAVDGLGPRPAYLASAVLCALAAAMVASLRHERAAGAGAVPSR